MYRLGLIALATLSLTATSATAIPHGSSNAGEATKPPEVQVRGPIVGTLPMVDFDEQYEVQVDYYLNVVVPEQRAVEAYLDALYQEQLRQEAARQAAIVAAQRTVTVPRVTSTVTGVCGGATNGADQFIGRESGGNPGVYNTGGSGAWGCYQIMPGTWASSCSDLGQHGSADPAAQAACASRLPLSAWGG